VREELFSTSDYFSTILLKLVAALPAYERCLRIIEHSVYILFLQLWLRSTWRFKRYRSFVASIWLDVSECFQQFWLCHQYVIIFAPASLQLTHLGRWV